MNIILAMAGIVIKELYRRKDFYVLFVLTALITLMMGSVNFFHDSQVVRLLKQVCLLLIWVSCLVIAIGTTARQIPAERENRTIFPLLAKPVTRAQLILGKFAGCWLACAVALLVFYLFFGVVTAAREQHLPMVLYLKAVWMQWMMLGVVVALALLGSVVFAAPSSNFTILFIFVIGILVLGRHLNQVAGQQAEPMCSIIYAIYFLIPHLEWYDARAFITYDRPMPGLIDCGLATLYAVVYIALLLFSTWLVFRRKPLNL